MEKNPGLFDPNQSETNTVFAVVVGDEIATIMNIPKNTNLHDILENGPSVFDVTDMNYKPAIGSIWDGLNFVIPENVDAEHDVPDVQVEEQECKTFVYLIDNVCVKRTKLYKNSLDGGLLISAFLSNPKFVDITNMVDNPANATKYLGWFIKDGQLVENI